MSDQPPSVRLLGTAPAGYDPVAHYERVRNRALQTAIYDPEQCSEDAANLVIPFIKNRTPNDAVCEALVNFAIEMLVAADYYAPYLPEPIGDPEYLKYEYDIVEKALDPSARAYIRTFTEGLVSWLVKLCPAAAFDERYDDGREPPFKVPLHALLREPLKETVSEFVRFFLSTRHDDSAYVPNLTKKVIENAAALSGVTDLNDAKAKVTPPDNSDLEGEALIDGYLKGTPAHEFLSMKLPFDIPDTVRYEHTHILGPSGSGKTTLMQQLIVNDLMRDDPPAMVIIDPKNTMLERLAGMSIFDPTGGRLHDHLVIVDPTRQPLPALGMFAPGNESQDKLIDNFAYVFSQAKQQLTGKQATLFNFVVRYLMKVPGATLDSLLDVLDDNHKKRRFAPDFERVTTGAARRFFTNEFYESNYANTHDEIKPRVYSLLDKPGVEGMFNQGHRALDMFDCLQQRKIVLVTTGMNTAMKSAHQLLGRYIIALTFSAALARINIPKSQWHPAFLYIDEFQEFADEEKTAEMLRLCREYNLGIVLAHQAMHCVELSQDMQNAISTNTSVKFCHAPEGLDINYMARDLKCSSDWLKRQTKSEHDGKTKFACLIRSQMSHPVSLELPLFPNDAVSMQPKMPAARYEELRRAKAAELASSAKTESPPTPANVQPPVQSPAGAATPVSQPAEVAAESQEASDALPSTGAESGDHW